MKRIMQLPLMIIFCITAAADTSCAEHEDLVNSPFYHLKWLVFSPTRKTLNHAVYVSPEGNVYDLHPHSDPDKEGFEAVETDEHLDIYNIKWYVETSKKLELEGRPMILVPSGTEYEQWELSPFKIAAWAGAVLAGAYVGKTIFMGDQAKKVAQPQVSENGKGGTSQAENKSN